MGKHQLFLCLGGNLGNKAEIFAETMAMIRNKIGEEVAVSSIYTSPPWGFDTDDLFWNQVVVVETVLSPGEVMKEIAKIENHFGRERMAGIYLSRKMDLDLLFYDQLIFDSEKLIIPHPSIALRRFVLTPLAEIAPGFIHPVAGKSIADLLGECPDSSLVRIVKNY